MPFKPMKRRDFERWIRQYGWSLQKGSVDWTLLDENQKPIVRNILIFHPGNEVSPVSIKKVKEILTQMGLDSLKE